MIKLSKKFYLFFALVSALLVLTSCATILNGYKISLDDSEYQIRLGQSLEINPTVTQNNEPCEVELVFHSYNEEVVSFEGNVLTAKKAGTAKIKVAIAEDTKVYDTAIVTVVDDASLEAEFVYEKHMIKGKTQEITYHFINGDDTRVLDFVSQNEDVIQVVNHNQLKAVGKGVAIVETRVYSTFDERIYLDYEFEITVDYQDYTIEYDFSGGVEDEHLNPKTYNEGSDFVLNIPTREYYKFDGWYNGEVKVERLAGNQTGDLTLKARWVPEEYHINYVYEGGHEGTANPTTYNVESDFTLNSPVRDDYEFVGWFSGDTKVEKLANGLHGDLTLVARWAAKSYHITYDFAKGTEDSALNPTTYSIESDFTLKAPTREHYEFVGWFNGDVKVEHLAGDQTGDLTLTAHWEATKYSVTYEFAGGTVDNNLNPATYTVEDNFTLKAPTRAGYDFTGWYDEKGTKVEHLGGDVTGNLKLTAQYDEIFNKISDVLAASFTGTAKVRGIVVAVYNEGLLLKDETGLILAYQKDTEPNFAKGDFVKVEGSKDDYKGSTQIACTKITALDSEIEGLELPNDSSLVKATAENVDNAYDNNSYNESYFEFILKLSSTGTYVNAPLEGAKVTINLKLSKANSAGLSTAFGKYYRVKGYYVNHSGTSPIYFNVIVAEITELTAQEKVDITFESLSDAKIYESVKDGQPYVDPELAKPFEDVIYKWTVKDSEKLISNGNWKINEEGQATFTLEISCGDATTKTKDFTVDLIPILAKEKVQDAYDKYASNSFVIPEQMNGKDLNVPTVEVFEGVNVVWSSTFLKNNVWEVTKKQEVELKVTISCDDVEKFYTWNVTVLMHERVYNEYYELVSNADDLAFGDKIIIVGSHENVDFVLGEANSNGNNRLAIVITKDSSTIIKDVTGAEIIELVEGARDKQFAFKLANGSYLSATGGTKNNYLKEQSSVDGNASWSITIAEDVATIKANGTSKRNWIRFNFNNSDTNEKNKPLFSCYEKDQSDVQIFKHFKIEVTDKDVADELLNSFKEQIPSELDSNFTLPSHDSLTWSIQEETEYAKITLSSNEVVVTRPEHGQGNQTIHFVATYIYYGEEYTQTYESVILEKDEEMSDEQIYAILDGILEEILDTVPADEDSIPLPSSDTHVSYSIASGDAGKVSGNTLTVIHPSGSSDAEITLRVTYEINGKSLYKDKIIKIVAVQVVEKTYEYSFTSSVLKTSGGTASLSGINWAYPSIGYSGYDGSKGQQIGSSGSPSETFTLSTSDFKGKISKVVVNASGASKIKGNVSVQVGGSLVGSAQSLTTSAADYTFTLDSPQSGSLEIILTQTSSKALYIKSITVYYYE